MQEDHGVVRQIVIIEKLVHGKRQSSSPCIPVPQFMRGELSASSLELVVGGLRVRMRPVESSRPPLIAQHQNTVDPIIPDNARMACIRKTKLAGSSAE